MLALGTGWQALAEMWNIASALALCAGSYLLARGMGVGPSGALAGGVLVASVPLVLFQTFSAYVDLFGSACLIAGLGLFVGPGPAVTASSTGARALVLSGLGCGLAVGTKPTLWPYAALVAVGVVASLIWSSAASGRRMRLLLLFLAATTAPCFFWFVRGYAATGNPLYPIAVEVPGLLSLSGLHPSEITDPNYHLNFVRSRAEWFLYPWIEFKRHGYSFGTGSGLGPVFAAFVPVGLLYTLWSVRGLDPGPPCTLRIACSVGFILERGRLVGGGAGNASLRVPVDRSRRCACHPVPRRGIAAPTRGDGSVADRCGAPLHVAVDATDRAGGSQANSTSPVGAVAVRTTCRS